MVGYCFGQGESSRNIGLFIFVKHGLLDNCYLLKFKALQGAGLGSNAIVSYAPFIFAVATRFSNLFCSWVPATKGATKEFYSACL